MGILGYEGGEPSRTGCTLTLNIRLLIVPPQDRTVLGLRGRGPNMVLLSWYGLACHIACIMSYDELR